jgi:hypothetical protein
MAVKNDLADIETEVGRIYTVLGCGEYDRKDLGTLLICADDMHKELREVQSKHEKYMDLLFENTVAMDRAGRISDALDSAECNLSNAIDELRQLKAGDDINAVSNALFELECCVRHLTEAMEV